MQTAKPKKTGEFFTAEAQPAISPSVCSVSVHSAGKTEHKSYHQGQRLTDITTAHEELSPEKNEEFPSPWGVLQPCSREELKFPQALRRLGQGMVTFLSYIYVQELLQKSLQHRAVRLGLEKEKLSAPKTV